MVNHFIYLHGHTVVVSLAKAYHKVVDVMGSGKRLLGKYFRGCILWTGKWFVVVPWTKCILNRLEFKNSKLKILYFPLQCDDFNRGHLRTWGFLVKGAKYLFQTLKRCSHKLNSKTNGLDLSFKAIFRHWNCFVSSVQRMARMDMD